MKITCTEMEKHRLIRAIERSEECPFTTGTGFCDMVEDFQDSICGKCFEDRVKWEITGGGV